MALSDEAELFNIAKKVHLFYFPVGDISAGEPVYCMSVVEIMINVILATSSIIPQYISRHLEEGNQGGLMRQACRQCTSDPASRGTVWYTAETDRLTGKLDFKASSRRAGFIQCTVQLQTC